MIEAQGSQQGSNKKGQKGVIGLFGKTGGVILLQIYWKRYQLLEHRAMNLNYYSLYTYKRMLCLVLKCRRSKTVRKGKIAVEKCT